MNTMENTPSTVLAAWEANQKACAGGWNPLDALKQAKETPWLVDGVIPANSIVWVVGAPKIGKTFTLMDMAACVSTGRPWMGRQCDQATVLYVAAEGGTDIHVRRAAAELAAGAFGPINIVQSRPMIAEPEGLAELMGLVQFSTDYGGRFISTGGIRFDTVKKAQHEVEENYRAYLMPEEVEKFEALDRFEALTERKEDGERLRPQEVQELVALGETLKPWHGPAANGCAPEDSIRENLEFLGRDLAQGRLSAVERAVLKYEGYVAPFHGHPSKKVLLIIDTFSQTAADDTKAVVSRYVKHLRDLIEEAERAGGSISVVVIDHLTKSGGTFMGAQAKQGDSDAMIEIERHGQLVTMSCGDTMKAAKPFDPIHLELVPFALDGHFDARGRALTSLIVKDGERVHRIRQAAGTSEETAAATVLRLLADMGRPCAREELRAQFLALPANEGKKPGSAERAFNRAVAALDDDEIITVLDGVISYAQV